MLPRNATDAHRPLAEQHLLTAILSHVEQRTISNDYTIQFRGQRYQIAPGQVRIGMRGEKIRVEVRLDDSLAFRYQGQYLSLSVCGGRTEEPTKASQPVRKDHNRGGRSHWMNTFHLTQSPAVWKSIRTSNSSS